MTAPYPRISFGMIVLNGEPFLRYNLRALYPYAHEIIVVEGAVPAAADLATPDGHSTDGTLQTLQRFKAEEDPANKLIIITRDGFWEGEKGEMSQAYAQRATGDYLWQVDSDEFYKDEDMEAIMAMLRDDPTITAMSFAMLTFWGSIDYVVDSWYLRRGAAIYHRLFRWGTGYAYVSHRPPTVHDELGRDLRKIHWFHGQTLAKQGIKMYHYSLVFPKQVLNKNTYYSHAKWAKRTGAQAWAQAAYVELRRPFHMHNVFKYPGWILRYRGTHPTQIEMMWQDIQAGYFDMELRRTDDIERLVSARWYNLLIPIVRLLDYPARVKAAIEGGLKRILPHAFKRRLKRLVSSILRRPIGQPR